MLSTSSLAVALASILALSSSAVALPSPRTLPTTVNASFFTSSLIEPAPCDIENSPHWDLTNYTLPTSASAMDCLNITSGPNSTVIPPGSVMDNFVWSGPAATLFFYDNTECKDDGDESYMGKLQVKAAAVAAKGEEGACYFGANFTGTDLAQGWQGMKMLAV